jgi:Rad3-related DNA helicase
LLDEQLVVYDTVRARARAGLHDNRKTVILVRGGPGTGKSVIALNLLSDLALEERNAQYVTGSRAFTQTLRKIVGTRAGVQFKYFNSYGAAQADEIDVLICDEAHRLRETSSSRFTPRAARTNKPQIQELIEAARVSVWFIDDRQNVRPDEIGSSALVREHAAAHNCRLLEFELEAQFRCAGSEAFVSWVNNTLELERTPHVLWNLRENFEFKMLALVESKR